MLDTRIILLNHFDPSSLPEVEIRLREDVAAAAELQQVSREQGWRQAGGRARTRTWTSRGMGLCGWGAHERGCDHEARADMAGMETATMVANEERGVEEAEKKLTGPCSRAKASSGMPERLGVERIEDDRG